MKNKKTLLMILDGWGIGDGSKSDVISQVPTPNLIFLKKIIRIQDSLPQVRMSDFLKDRWEIRKWVILISEQEE